MIHQALQRAVPIELSADPRIERRIKRLAVVSAVVLGLIWALAVTSLETPPIVAMLLGAGWVAMPSVLVAGLRRPSVRYWLVVPSSLVSIALLAICLVWLPETPAAAVGWLSMTAGVLLGGVMGAWFWFRLLPVPAALDDPTSAARWTLIAVHVGLIVGGLGLVIVFGRC